MLHFLPTTAACNTWSNAIALVVIECCFCTCHYLSTPKNKIFQSYIQRKYLDINASSDVWKTLSRKDYINMFRKCKVELKYKDISDFEVLCWNIFIQQKPLTFEEWPNWSVFGIVLIKLQHKLLELFSSSNYIFTKIISYQYEVKIDIDTDSF